MKKFINDLILKAGDTVMETYGKAEILRSKENVEAIVTEADLASEKNNHRRY